MKRLILLTALLLAGAANIRAEIKVDEAGIRKKLEKLQADSKDPKKGAKPAVWIDLGKAYHEAATAPTTGVYSGMDDVTANLMLGKPQSTSQEVIGGREFQKRTYPTLETYVSDGQVVFWMPTLVIQENALGLAADSYRKAYELDKGTATKVKAGLRDVANAFRENAGNYYSAQRYAEAGAAFAAAYDLLNEAPINEVDTVTCFNAGYTFTLGGNFEEGLKYLKKAIDYGYESKGDAYYFLFHCYYGLKDVPMAKATLLEGIKRYPTNNNIMDGLIGLYAETGENPQDIIPYVQEALRNDPNNSDLYAGMGFIYNKMGDVDAAVESFHKAVELAPDNYGNNFNLALMYIRKGEKIAEDARAKTITSQEEMDKILAVQNDAYRNALAPLEKAHALQPDDIVVVEYLKTIYFRLRDEPGFMEKYTKYNELFKSMQQ